MLLALNTFKSSCLTPLHFNVVFIGWPCMWVSHDQNFLSLTRRTDLLKRLNNQLFTIVVVCVNVSFWFHKHGDQCSFVVCWQKIISSLMQCENESTDVIVKFQEYLEYDDLRYFTMKSMLELLKSDSDVSTLALNEWLYQCRSLCFSWSSSDVNQSCICCSAEAMLNSVLMQFYPRSQEICVVDVVQLCLLLAGFFCLCCC